MKALSIRQPWAWLIVNGHKDVENRSWARMPRYVGPLLIHASKGCTRAEYEEAVSYAHGVDPSINVPSLDSLDRGGIVGRVFMEGCVDRSLSPWFFGPIGLALSRPQRLDFIPYKGQLGFFEVPDSLIEQRPGAGEGA